MCSGFDMFVKVFSSVPLNQAQHNFKGQSRPKKQLVRNYRSAEKFPPPHYFSLVTAAHLFTINHFSPLTSHLHQQRSVQSHLVNLSFLEAIFCFLPPCFTSTTPHPSPLSSQTSSVVQSGGIRVSSASLPGTGDTFLTDGDYWWHHWQRSQRHQESRWRGCSQWVEGDEWGGV